MFYALVAPGLWRLALGIISIALCGELNPQTENGSPCFENPVTLRGAFAQTQQAVSNLVESNSGAFHTPLAFLPTGEFYQMEMKPIKTLRASDLALFVLKVQGGISFRGTICVSLKIRRCFSFLATQPHRQLV
jgi:hypothetical protein